MWDLRVPSGIFFAFLGLILCALGLLSPGTRAPLADHNVNFYSGLMMLAFGGVLLWLARRRTS
ncbi:MAG: hypothetical protein ACK5AZ_02810 [Bryobacteraceae bacterium]